MRLRQTSADQAFSAQELKYMFNSPLLVLEVPRARFPANPAALVQVEVKTVAARHECPPEAIQPGQAEEANRNACSRFQAVPVDAYKVEDSTQQSNEENPGHDA